MTKRKMPDYWDEAARHLSRKDKVLKKIIANFPGELLASEENAFRTLTRSVVSQQISVKAADSIWKRLEQGVGGMTPPNLRSAMPEDLRAHGLSRQKVAYLHSLADFFLARKHAERDWQNMSDEEVIKDLTQIKGIGRWTAEMFLIFHLLRPDIFPIADLGLQKAIQLGYNNKEKLPREAMLALGEPWRPYRSVATWYLWRSLDPVPVEY